MAVTFKPFVEKLGGTTAAAYVGNSGELFYDPETTTLRVADGSTPGGTIINTGGGAESDTLATVTSRGATTTDQITTAGIVTTANSTIGGHLIPDANEQYDLGSATNKFRDLYLSSATIKMGESENTIGFSGSDFQVNGQPVNTLVQNTTIIQNIQNGSAWQLQGPFTTEQGAADAGIQIGQAYYDNGGTVRVRQS